MGTGVVQQGFSCNLPRLGDDPARRLLRSGLVESLCRGEPSALGHVYDQHHEALRAFARRLLGDEDAAEDLVQDVFLALPKAIRRYREEAPLRSFLYGMTANHARHHLRAAARRRAAHGRSEEEAREPATPEETARDGELTRAVMLALDAISFEQRVAFVLSEIEEYSAAEIGGMVGVPEATVRTRLFHGKRKLRELLEKRGAR